MLLADTPSVALGSAALVANNGFASANFRVSGGQLTPGPNTVKAVYGGYGSGSVDAYNLATQWNTQCRKRHYHRPAPPATELD
jgi:hypothetical protein